jgi:hypothetical protein
MKDETYIWIAVAAVVGFYLYQNSVKAANVLAATTDNSATVNQIQNSVAGGESFIDELF